MSPSAEHVEMDPDVECADYGHRWMPAGGGMLICARCEETCWGDDLEAPDAER